MRVPYLLGMLLIFLCVMYSGLSNGSLGPGGCAVLIAIIVALIFTYCRDSGEEVREKIKEELNAEQEEENKPQEEERKREA